MNVSGLTGRDGGDGALKRGGCIQTKGRYKVLDVSVSPFSPNIYAQQAKGSEQAFRNMDKFSFYSADPSATTSMEAHSCREEKITCYAISKSNIYEIISRNYDLQY